MADALNADRETFDPLVSLRNLIVFSSSDWGRSGEMAWLHGVVVGWDCDVEIPSHVHDSDCSALPDLAAEFNWNADAVARLRRLRQSWSDLASARERLRPFIETAGRAADGPSTDDQISALRSGLNEALRLLGLGDLDV